ncbi:MAG: methyl-accepting chemotaxis protein [Desulfovibrionales bacterium]|nr:methyl-accepting chemotaxis protein [Desulfovibrionales bacterium]
MFRKITIKARVFVLLGTFLLFIAAILIFNIQSTITESEGNLTRINHMRLEDEKETLKVATHSAAVAITANLAGVTDVEEQRSILRRSVENFRFKPDGSGYFFIYEGTVNVALPTKKSIIGKDLGNVADKNGVYYVRDLQKAAQAGGGFVSFIFNKPGKGDQPKLAYSEAIPNTPFWIGTGVYIDNIEAERQALQQAFDERLKQSLTWRLSVIAAVLFLCITPFCIFLVRSIVLPIREANEISRSIADGNLDVAIRVEGKDEISKLEASLATMATTLRTNQKDMQDKEREANHQATIANEAAERAEQAMREAAVATNKGITTAADRLSGLVARINANSTSLAASSQQLEKGSEVQLSRISDTATAMEQMNATVLEVARNASVAAERTESSKFKAEEGQKIVNETINAIENLQTIAESLQSNMNQLGKESDSIGEVMNIINDIADQTNLLALNAAIEAARAGDAGRGFAVVADEVRKLAEKTMGATNEVGNSISTIQSLAQKNIEGVKHSTEAMETTAGYSQTSGEVLAAIVTMTHDAATQVQSIATAAEEQSAASDEITRSIDEITTIAEESRTMAGDSGEHVSTLHSEAQNLQEIIDQLKNESSV